MTDDQRKRRWRVFGQDRGPIRDGDTLVVPMMAMDSTPPVERPLVTDIEGGTAGVHRPGYRSPRDTSLSDARETAYREYADAISNAWRGDLDCSGYRAVRDTSLADAREAAYDEYANAVSNAWRGHDEPR